MDENKFKEMIEKYKKYPDKYCEDIGIKLYWYQKNIFKNVVKIQ